MLHAGAQPFGPADIEALNQAVTSPFRCICGGPRLSHDMMGASRRCSARLGGRSSMNRYIRPVLVTLAIATGACAQQPARPTMEADTAALNALRNQFVAAYKAGDADKVAALYTDDAVVLPKDEATVKGRSAIAASDKAFFDQFTPKQVVLSSEEIKIMGDWAFDRGTYKLTIAPKAGGQSATAEGRYLVLLQRQTDGSWKAARYAGNGSTPPPAPPPPAPHKKKRK
jgi:uncharacterized protein (TIGR02246 family)